MTGVSNAGKRHTTVEWWNGRLCHRAADEDDADDGQDNSERMCRVHRLAEHPFAVIAVPALHRLMIGISTLAPQPHSKSSIVPVHCAGAKATLPPPAAASCPRQDERHS